jgi:molybdate transport system substrate-binding protein
MNSMRFSYIFLLAGALIAASACQRAKTPAAMRLLVFAGAASQPATEELARAFEESSGVAVELNFGGSGYVLSQMELARQGDVFFPGSSDYMEIAKAKGLIDADTERAAAYLAPAINVRKGNPKGIRGLKDLTRPGLKIAIANPEGVCVGLYAAEIIEANLDAAEKQALRANLSSYTESCSKTAAVVSLKAVDAAIGWEVFAHWDPERIENVPLAPEEVRRIGYIPIAVTRYSTRPELARKFIDFVLSPAGAAVFAKHGYFTSAQAAMEWVGAPKPVGGLYELPQEWRSR